MGRPDRCGKVWDLSCNVLPIASWATEPQHEERRKNGPPHAGRLFPSTAQAGHVVNDHAAICDDEQWAWDGPENSKHRLQLGSRGAM